MASEQKGRRIFAASFALALAAVLGLFAYSSSAATGLVQIYTSQGTAQCYWTGGPAPAVFQGQPLRIKFDEFTNGSSIRVDVTFPDGRVFDYGSAFDVYPDPNGLDGVIDQPFNGPVQIRTYSAGSVLDVPAVTGKMPYGCYIVTARDSLGKQASGFFVVVAGGGPAANPGPATFSVTRNRSVETQGAQGSIVDLIGHNWPANRRISLWLTAPDGTVINYPAQDAFGNYRPEIFTDNGGNFSTTFVFEGKNPIGFYQFTALDSSTGLRIIAPFTLTAPPVAQRGPAVLRVSVPFDASAPQATTFELVGELFNPYERVDIWVTLPDGAVRGLPSQFADGAGNFFARLLLDERLPTGFYQVTAKDTSQLVIGTLTLEQRGGVTGAPDTPNVTSCSGQLVEPGYPCTGPAPETVETIELNNPGPVVAP